MHDEITDKLKQIARRQAEKTASAEQQRKLLNRQCLETTRRLDRERVERQRDLARRRVLLKWKSGDLWKEKARLRRDDDDDDKKLPPIRYGSLRSHRGGGGRESITRGNHLTILPPLSVAKSLAAIPSGVDADVESTSAPRRRDSTTLRPTQSLTDFQAAAVAAEPPPPSPPPPPPPTHEELLRCRYLRLPAKYKEEGERLYVESFFSTISKSKEKSEEKKTKEKEGEIVVK